MVMFLCSYSVHVPVGFEYPTFAIHVHVIIS